MYAEPADASATAGAAEIAAAAAVMIEAWVEVVVVAAVDLI